VGQLAEKAEATETPAAPKAAALGLSLQPLTPELASRLGLEDTTGVLVREVDDSSPAASAGLRAGDVIVEVDRKPVRTVADVRNAMSGRSAKNPLVFLVHREGASLYIAVTA